MTSEFMSCGASKAGRIGEDRLGAPSALRAQAAYGIL